MLLVCVSYVSSSRDKQEKVVTSWLSVRFFYSTADAGFVAASEIMKAVQHVEI